MSDTLSLYGYNGPYYTSTADNSVRVLTATVTTSTGAVPWTARGLVLNGLLQQDAPNVVVTAVLSGVGGQVLATVTGTVPMTLRPGEPGPFQLSAVAPASTVASVAYSVAMGTTTAPVPRTLRVDNNWEAPAGVRPPFSNPAYSDLDPTGTAEPDVSGGMITNDGATAIASPSVTSAWFDATGHVVFWATTPLVDAAGARIASLAPGAAAQFVLNAGANAPDLSTLVKGTWAYAS